MTVSEQAVVDLWSEILEVDDPPLDQRFVEAGGQSLAAARLAAAIRYRLGADVSLSDVLEQRDLRGLVILVTSRGDAAAVPGLADVGPSPAGLVSLQTDRKLKIERSHALAHRRIVSVVYQVTGDVDLLALDRAVEDLGRRHQILLSRFADRGAEVTLEYDPSARLTLQRIVAEPGDTANSREAVEAHIQRLAGAPFDLTSAPLARVAAVVVSSTELWFVLSVQHYIFDGRSLTVVLRDLAEAYDAHRRQRPWTPPPLPATHTDFAHWQRVVLSGHYRQRLEDFWKVYLDGANLSVKVRGMPDGRAFGTDGATAQLDISATEAESWRQFARTSGVTLFSLMLAGITVAIAACGGPADVSAHTSVANRRLKEFEDIVGYFSHGLVIRCQASLDDSFGQFVDHVYRSCRAAYDHQDLPYSELVKMMWPEAYAVGPQEQTLYFDIYDPRETRLTIGEAVTQQTNVSSSTADPGINAFVISAGDGTGMALQLLHNFDSVASDLAATLLAAWRTAMSTGIATPADKVATIMNQVATIRRGAATNPTAKSGH